MQLSLDDQPRRAPEQGLAGDTAINPHPRRDWAPGPLCPRERRARSASKLFLRPAGGKALGGGGRASRGASAPRGAAGAVGAPHRPPLPSLVRKRRRKVRACARGRCPSCRHCCPQRCPSARRRAGPSGAGSPSATAASSKIYM